MLKYSNISYFLIISAFILLGLTAHLWISNQNAAMAMLVMPAGLIGVNLLRRRNTWGFAFSFVSALLFILFSPRYIWWSLELLRLLADIAGKDSVYATYLALEILGYLLALTSLLGFIVWSCRKQGGEPEFRITRTPSIVWALTIVMITAIVSMSWNLGTELMLSFLMYGAAFVSLSLIIMKKFEGWAVLAVESAIAAVTMTIYLDFIWVAYYAIEAAICAVAFIQWRRMMRIKL